MYKLIRPLLFRLDAEQAHGLTLNGVRLAGQFPITNYLLRKMFAVNDERLAVEAFGLRFKNPVGLAAGYDKNGVALEGLSGLGFGHIEVGTVTLKPQGGNPKPRVYRVPRAGAVINAMGFPNRGVAALPHPLSPREAPLKQSGRGFPGENSRRERGDSESIVIGINIGKNKDTSQDRAAEEYAELFRRVQGRADYVTVNVSSPNTPGLRQLQGRARLDELLRAVMMVRDGLTPRVPVLVKIAPDLSEVEIDDVLSVAEDCRLDGIIATNTTTSREGLPESLAKLPGGLSGRPLKARATEVIRYVARHTRLPVIGVGGIASAEDALEKLRAGAKLIQVYTGLAYAGPGLAREINLGLLRVCELEGAQSLI